MIKEIVNKSNFHFPLSPPADHPGYCGAADLKKNSSTLFTTETCLRREQLLQGHCLNRCPRRIAFPLRLCVFAVKAAPTTKTRRRKEFRTATGVSGSAVLP